MMMSETISEKLQRYKVQRIMTGGGLKFDEFNPRYESLPDEDKDAIRWVAWRLLLTYYLRYDVDIPGVFEHHIDMSAGYVKWLVNSAIPSLEIYLLFTCLDTLAGSKHLGFPEWLESQLQDEKLSKTEIVNYYKKYKKECGVGSNLRRLFENLPDVTIDWLSNNAVFRRVPKYVYGKGEYNHQRFEELSENPITSSRKNITKLLFEYYYNYWRNPFTHQSRTRAPHFVYYVNPTNDVSEIPPIPLFTNQDFLASDPETSYAPMSYEQGQLINVGRLKHNKNYWQLFLSLRTDEATILRVIIQSHLFQLLDITVTSQHLEKFIYGLQFQSALRGYARSTEVNMNLLEELQSISQGCSSRDMYHFQGIPKLNIWWAEKLLELFQGKGSIKHIRRYSSAVKTINEKIDCFNSSTPPVKSSDENWGEQARLYRQTAQKFLNELFREISPELMSILMGEKREKSAKWVLPIAASPNMVA
jgi:hypothetical protein